ncbi:hypothetical protein ACFSTC_32765 [Nonomuraea ferruginea]
MTVDERGPPVLQRPRPAPPVQQRHQPVRAVGDVRDPPVRADDLHDRAVVGGDRGGQRAGVGLHPHGVRLLS